MRGPILVSNSMLHPLVMSVSQDVKFEPSGSATDRRYEFEYKSSTTDYRNRFVYRQERGPLGYVYPLPYDAYGVQWIKEPLVEMHEHRQTVNTTPWVSPWRFQNRFTNFVGVPQGLPLALLPQLPKPDPEGELINAARIQAGNMKVNLLVTLKELNKTAGMIRSRTKKIADVVDLVRKGNYYGAARLLGLKHPPKNVRDGRAWADNFLEYQYGWMPLIQDTIGYAQYLADFLRDAPVIVAKAKVEIAGSVQYIQKNISLGKDFPGYSVTVSSEGQAKEYHQVVLQFRLKSYLFREINQLGLLHLPATGWELTKLSFVWDWVFRVGELLGSMDALSGLEFHSGSYTRMARNTSAQKAIGWSVPSASYPTSVKSVSNSMTPGESNGFVLRREIYSSVPPPAFVVHVPGRSHTIKRGIVAVALLRQRLSIPTTSYR